MKVFKTGVVLMLAVFFIACGSSEPANTNSSQTAAPVASAPPPAPPASSNTSAPPATVAAPSNANQSTEAKPAEGKKDAKPEAKPAPEINMAALFGAQKCTGCHGADGKGKIKGAPDFTDAAWQKKVSDADMIEQIKLGKPPKMPPYEGKLTDGQIKALVAYIRSFAK
ncbi:MAG TPA: c-type cytochrome [Blastocatellia bacterium]